MILSVSRRTDILAFYSNWFFNRLKEGYVLVRNPFNYHQVSKIELNPNAIDCIVLWTKDPSSIINNLDKIKNFYYYFQITINPYDKTIEQNVPSKNKIINSFQTLSKKIGKNRVVWRYDPILITDKIDIYYHVKNFEILALQLANYTNKCIISFVDLYNKNKLNLEKLNNKLITNKVMHILGSKLSKIASCYKIVLETCSEEVDLSMFGIKHGKCIDDHLISNLLAKNIKIKKDKNQRNLCGSAASIDIGAYNSCMHRCLYCYANFSEKTILKNILKHDINSPMLIGNIEKNDKIINRKMN